MKLFFKGNEIYTYSDIQIKNGLSDGLTELSSDELDKHLNPEKYLSDEEKLLVYRQNMPTLSPIEFDIKLNNAGLYDAVQELIKDKFEMRIAYNRATFFSRTASFIDQARIALGLTDEQVDAMWGVSIHPITLKTPQQALVPNKPRAFLMPKN